MKKILSLILIIGISTGFTACGKSTPTTATTETTIAKVETTEKVKTETPKIYTQGEEAIIKNDDDKAMYSIRIDNVTVANDYIYKKDSNFDTSKEIVAVNYTYKNIGKTDENLVIISADDLILSDTTGSIGLASNQYLKGLPKHIPVGTNLTIQCHYGLNNKTDKVKINFSSEAYKKNGTITFELPVK